MFLRSANRNANDSNNFGVVNSTGNVNNNNATNAYRAQPDFLDDIRNRTFRRKGQEMTLRKGADILAKTEDSLCKLCGSDGTGNHVAATEPTSTAELDYALSVEGLYESLRKCVHGTNWKTSVASFELNAYKKCHNLSRQLLSGTYEPKPLKTFEITRPKRRTCTAIGISDRVYQRSLNDNVVYSKVVKHLIKENCACQKGKGTDYARRLLKRHLFRLNYNQGTNKQGYALCMDVKSYYATMSHELVLSQFKKYLHPSEYRRVEEIITRQYPGDVGFTPGSQLIQIAGIMALNDIDHFVKEQLGIKYYVRYMDDFVLVHKSRSYLQYCKNEMSNRLNALGFKTNESKTQIVNVYRQPVTFLGFNFKLKPSGKVVTSIRSDKFREQKRRCRRLSKYLNTETFDEVAKQAVSYLSRNNTSSRYVNSYTKTYNNVRKEMS